MSNIWNTHNCILCIRAFVFLESYTPQKTSSRLEISLSPIKAVDFFPWPLQDSCLSHLARYLPTTSPQWSRAWFRSPQTIISKSTGGRQAINRRRCNCCWTTIARTTCWANSWQSFKQYWVEQISVNTACNCCYIDYKQLGRSGVFVSSWAAKVGQVHIDGFLSLNFGQADEYFVFHCTNVP